MEILSLQRTGALIVTFQRTLVEVLVEEDTAGEHQALTGHPLIGPLLGILKALDPMGYPEG